MGSHRAWPALGVLVIASAWSTSAAAEPPERSTLDRIVAELEHVEPVFATRFEAGFFASEHAADDALQLGVAFEVAPWPWFSIGTQVTAVGALSGALDRAGVAHAYEMRLRYGEVVSGTFGLVASLPPAVDGVAIALAPEAGIEVRAPFGLQLLLRGGPSFYLVRFPREFPPEPTRDGLPIAIPQVRLGVGWMY